MSPWIKAEEHKVELVETDSKVILTITDSGEGIPESAHERMFEPFQTTKIYDEVCGFGLELFGEFY